MDRDFVWRSGMAAVLTVALSATCHAQATPEGLDWPRWRGPDSNGISVETAWTAAKLSPLTYLWRATVGPGFSGVSVVGDRLYTAGRWQGKDQVVCLDARTGKQLWSYSYSCDPGQYPGPKATPTVDSGRVYSFSTAGDLLCLDAARGRRVWQKSLSTDYGARSPICGFASSPLVWEDLLLLNAGVSGMAVERATGRLVWGTPGVGGYASVVPFETGAKVLMAVFGERALYAVDARTGAVAWSYPWVTYDGVNAADPLPIGDTLFISSNYGNGCALLKTGPDHADLLWKSASVASHFSPFVCLDGLIFANDGDANARSGAFVCLDAATGEERWRENSGVGSVLAVGGKLFLLDERGRLRVAEATGTGYREIAAATFPRSIYWTPPCFCRGRLYVRSQAGELFCVDLSS